MESSGAERTSAANRDDGRRAPRDRSGRPRRGAVWRRRRPRPRRIPV